MRRRNLSGLLVIAVLTSALTAFAAEDPPPPPPPPPPLEESGPIESPASGDWQIKGQNSLLDKSTGHVRHPMLSFFVGVPFSYYGYGGYVSAFSLGIGARFYIPIVSDGFLPMLNDSFGIEFGADTSILFGAYGYGTGFAFSIPAEVRWNFHIFPKLEAYAKVGVGVGFYFGNYVYPYFVPVANVGVLFHLSKTIALRAEVGYPAVKIGIGIAF
jgi:hypothetical protein